MDHKFPVDEFVVPVYMPRYPEKFLFTQVCQLRIVTKAGWHIYTIIVMLPDPWYIKLKTLSTYYTRLRTLQHKKYMHLLDPLEFMLHA